MTVRERFFSIQDKTLDKQNENKTIITYETGGKVFLKRNKRLGNKFSKIIVEKVVKEI